MRFEAIRPFVEERDVLDVGCGSGFGRPDWMHSEISKVARSVAGIDLDEEQVAAISLDGYSVRVDDAEDFDGPNRYDVVFAGELIEHLANPAGFLRSARQALRPGGVLVLTTPNPFAFPNFVYRLRGNALVNGDHVAWYCEDTAAQLLGRCAFDTVQVSYIAHPEVGSKLRRAIVRSIRRVLPPVLQWGTMMVVGTPVNSKDGTATQ